MKRVALIGHRGTGKTSLLKRLQSYAPLTLCLDLDQVLESATGRDCGAIFAENGEAEFRRLEQKAFAEVDAHTQGQAVYLAVGAGFDPAKIPAAWTALWVCRDSDARGRIFTDRPRLEPTLSALHESRARFLEREPRFLARADQIYLQEEGLITPDPIEQSLLGGDLKNLGGALTVLADRFARPGVLRAWADRMTRQGIRWFELRDDLLTEAQIQEALEILHPARTLMSFRDRRRAETTRSIITKNCLSYDWPLEWGLDDGAHFHSRHERESSLNATLAKLPDPARGVLKVAVMVENFAELLSGHRWQQAAPDRRVFLPRSHDGRWAWYRLLTGPGSPLAFFREDARGSSGDQPTLAQWARRQARPGQDFAAVLGDPVAHSFSPSEHFSGLPAPFFAVRVSETDWAAQALEILHQLGLRWAAVTAPLKRLAFAAASVADTERRALGSVNTLGWDKNQWRGTNTDVEGFAALVTKLDPTQTTAVWGGGGTLAMMQSLLPRAEYFSLRSGHNRRDEASRNFPPVQVIWAAGQTETMPPAAWKPSLVVDLGYREDSVARAYALAHGARYISGLEMFRVQAAAQREFWRKIK